VLVSDSSNNSSIRVFSLSHSQSSNRSQESKKPAKRNPITNPNHPTQPYYPLSHSINNIHSSNRTEPNQTKPKPSPSATLPTRQAINDPPPPQPSQRHTTPQHQSSLCLHHRVPSTRFHLGGFLRTRHSPALALLVRRISHGRSDQYPDDEDIACIAPASVSLYLRLNPHPHRRRSFPPPTAHQHHTTPHLPIQPDHPPKTKQNKQTNKQPR